MITRADLAHWRRVVPWSTDEQVEQDLVLSRLIVEIANHPLLGNELVFRGGTCFHKLWLDRPWRYSEDLDYVRRHPKARFDSTFVGDARMRVKIEMNTYERSPAKPIVTRPLQVESPWFSGHADVATFTLEELIATKIRALYQRRKGRDLFDMWLAVEQAGASPTGIADCFGPYRPDTWTAALALENLAAKITDDRFTTDLTPLVPEWPERYSIHAGAEIARQVIEAAG